RVGVGTGTDDLLRADRVPTFGQRRRLGHQEARGRLADADLAAVQRMLRLVLRIRGRKRSVVERSRLVDLGFAHAPEAGRDAPAIGDRVGAVAALDVRARTEVPADRGERDVVVAGAARPVLAATGLGDRTL